jgi:hypothetical protein
MYQQTKRELLEREAKITPGFPGLMERVKLEPVVEQPKTVNKKSDPAVVTDAGKKKLGRPKKTVI